VQRHPDCAGRVAQRQLYLQRVSVAGGCVPATCRCCRGSRAQCCVGGSPGRPRDALRRQRGLGGRPLCRRRPLCPTPLPVTFARPSLCRWRWQVHHPLQAPAVAERVAVPQAVHQGLRSAGAKRVEPEVGGRRARPLPSLDAAACSCSAGAEAACSDALRCRCLATSPHYCTTPHPPHASPHARLSPMRARLPPTRARLPPTGFCPCGATAAWGRRA
jgi:hypothetical protein